MALLLGVDTGGTYTDAVLIRDERDVIASAKALTTRHDLAIGIGEAITAVLKSSGADVSEIGMASLSTTLATNALVEGQGGRVGLIYVGFRERDLEAHGLREALGGDPALVMAGGHNHAGGQADVLDKAALSAWLETDLGISAFAVASQFATRNPAHELEVSEMIRAATGRPVSCSHHLSAKLNGPKRALTALLNARLIGMIARLIEKAEGKLAELGIDAPLMVVRGDGALISAAQARERPIETILSGPAASIVGARWMTGADHALVSDIGGTTTDVAVLRGGRPAIDPGGAQVGPWRTMVEAVAMRTTGLGGDSEVHVNDEGLVGGVTLGPRRVVPVSLIAMQAPDVVHGTLDQQLRSQSPGEYDARFVRAVPGIDAGGLADRDAALLTRIGADVQPVGAVLKTRMEAQALKRLVMRGLVQMSGVTPLGCEPRFRAACGLGCGCGSQGVGTDRTQAHRVRQYADAGRRGHGADDCRSVDASDIISLVRVCFCRGRDGFWPAAQSIGAPCSVAKRVGPSSRIGPDRGGCECAGDRTGRVGVQLLPCGRRQVGVSDDSAGTCGCGKCDRCGCGPCHDTSDGHGHFPCRGSVPGAPGYGP